MKGSLGRELIRPLRRLVRRLLAAPVESYITFFVVLFCVGFVFVQLGPSNVLANNTPAGGDMGAHVWGPAYLRDHLLATGRLTGWTPDWYAGFPAYQFYMVIPSLRDRAAQLRASPTASPSSWSPSAACSRCRSRAWAFGRLAACRSRRRRCSPSRPPCSCSTGRSRSTAATSRRPSPASSPSRSRSRFAVLYLGVVGRGLDDGQVPGLGRGAAGAHRALPPDPALLRAGRHRRLVRPPARRGKVRLRIWRRSVVGLVRGGVAARRRPPRSARQRCFEARSTPACASCVIAGVVGAWPVRCSASSLTSPRRGRSALRRRRCSPSAV